MVYHWYGFRYSRSSYSSLLIIPFLASDQKTLGHLPIERLAKHPHLEEHRFDKLGN
jgi:hypothetical protein